MMNGKPICLFAALALSSACHTGDSEQGEPSSSSDIPTSQVEHASDRNVIAPKGAASDVDSHGGTETTVERENQETNHPSADSDTRAGDENAPKERIQR